MQRETRELIGKGLERHVEGHGGACVCRESERKSTKRRYSCQARELAGADGDGEEEERRRVEGTDFPFHFIWVSIVWRYNKRGAFLARVLKKKRRVLKK